MKKQDITRADFSMKYIQDVFQAMPGGFFIYRADASEEIIYANEALLEIFECDTQDEFLALTGGCFPGLVYADDLYDVQRSIEDQIHIDQNHYDQVAYRIKTKHGKLMMVEDYGRFVLDPLMGPLYYVFISPAIIKYDSLTGLSNTSNFMTVAEEELHRKFKQGALPVLMSFNLSGMKHFNKNYGREEGDRLLVAVADILKRRFGSLHCSRFGEDHFYAYADFEDIENQLNGLIVDMHEINEGRTLPIKIGVVNYDPNISIAELCDRAKMACDSRDGAYGSGFKWFDESMAKRYDMQSYILEHVDEAIANNWIQVYFQPVIRSLTGRISSVEALARWIDPVMGMIAPGDFIPLLEENGLSYKVDLYMTRRVAEILQRRMKAGHTIVPVSINLSRADFDFCDPVEKIAHIADEHGIRRNLIAIEITESALVDDDGIIQSAVERFHDAGFEVWMDDFGSGYSSLNVLKDYDFDKLKIDMAFIKDATDRSQKIVTSMVRMAKKLGIHTLAEGVETQEQLDFLKSIGCEKIQGYHFGKPMPLDEAIENLINQDVTSETREIASFYDKVGLVDVVSDRSLALFLYDGVQFRLVYENEAYSKVIQLEGYQDEEIINIDMNQMDSSLRERFLHLAERARHSYETEEMTFVIRDGYYHYSFRMIANCRLGCMLLATIETSAIDEKTYASQLDKVVRNLVSTYNCIYLVDVEKDMRTVVISNRPDEKVGEEIHGILQYYENGKEVKEVHHSDVERFRRFQNLDYIISRLEESQRGNFSDVFRLKQLNGNYEWTEIRIIAIPESKHNSFLVCVSPSELEDQENKDSLVEGMLGEQEEVLHSGRKNRTHRMTDADFLYALVVESELKLFWKDTKRRFLGASNAFLAYYGFSSVQEILGKTDEEIGWHVKDAGFKADEDNVLRKGEVIKSSQGQNVIGGSARNISATKFPVYHNGKICGLMGYFVDTDEDISAEVQLMRNGMTDDVTGFMNIQGIMVSVNGYDDIYRTGRQDYTYISIEISNFDVIHADYGEKVAEHFILLVAERIRAEFEIGAMIGRSNGCSFVVCVKGLTDKELFEKMETLSESISMIREVDGFPCRVRSIYGMAKGSEADGPQEVVELARARLRAVKKGPEYQKNQEIAKLEQQPDAYNDFPMPYCVMKPMVDDQNQLVDFQFMFVNQKYCEMTGMTKAEMLGHGYFEKFPYTSEKWLEYGDRAVRGEYIRSRAYGGAMGQWLDFMMAPSSHPGCIIAIFYIDQRKTAAGRSGESNHITEDVIISIARLLSSEKDVSRAVHMALQEIGQSSGAERVHIFEFCKDQEHMQSTYEWNTSNVVESVDQKEVVYCRYEGWEEEVLNHRVIVFDDISGLYTDYPDIYHFLDSMGVERMMVTPLYVHNDELIGFLGVDNYDVKMEGETKKLLETSAFFIAARMRVPTM